MQKKQIISPPSFWSNINLGELINFRHLLLSLAWRDIKIKYAQTLIGFTWAIIHPLITILLLSFVFQKVANINTGDTPPLLFTLTGYAAWSYFSTLLVTAGNSILSAQQMIQKIYFPRLVLPLSKAVSGLVELMVIMVCILCFLIYYKFEISTDIIFLPFVLLLTILCGLAGGIWISALTVRYRDFRFITPFLVQIGLFITPIAYPMHSVPEKYLTLYYLNPMTGIVEAFRKTVLGVGDIFPSLYFSIGITSFLLITGIWYFGKVEKIMADII